MIVSQPHGTGHLLFLPLCPGTNHRLASVRMGRYVRQILSAEARDYLSSIGLLLKIWRQSNQYPPISTYRHIDCWFLLPRTNCDNHNYFKVVFDALEDAGIVTDDRYLLPRVQGVFHDAKNPQMIVAL